MNKDSSNENMSPRNNNINIVSPGSMNSNVYANNGVYSAYTTYESRDFTKNSINNGLVPPTSSNNNIRYGVSFPPPLSNQSCHWKTKNIQASVAIAPDNPNSAKLVAMQGGVQQPGLRYSSGISAHWKAKEQALLVQLLNENFNVEKAHLFGLIAQKLTGKSIRDVALRVQWMMDNSEKSVASASASASAGPRLRGRPPGKRASTSYNGVGKEKVRLTMELLNQSAKGLEKLSGKLAELQADVDPNLLSDAQKNIHSAMEKLKELNP